MIFWEREKGEGGRREERRKGKREGGRHQCQTETLIAASWKLSTGNQARNLGIWTNKLWVHRMPLNQLSMLVRAKSQDSDTFFQESCYGIPEWETDREEERRMKRTVFSNYNPYCILTWNQGGVQKPGLLFYPYEEALKSNSQKWCSTWFLDSPMLH